MLQECLAEGRAAHGKAERELEKLSGVMERLLPQIRYFLETGFVASVKKDQARAGPGRRAYWQCEINTGNGDVWPSLAL